MSSKLPILYAGSSNLPLAARVAEKLNTQLGKISISKHRDGEIKISLHDDLTEQCVYILQSTSAPVHEHLMELILIADAAYTARAKSVIGIIPYFGYSRSDRVCMQGRRISPNNSKIVSNMLSSAGINSIITVDLHSQELFNYFPGKIISIPIQKVFAATLRQLKDDIHVVIAPDMGAATRAWQIGQLLQCDTLVLNKICPRRQIGKLEHKNCLIVDDIIDSGKTITRALNMTGELGTCRAYICCSHAVLSEGFNFKAESNLINTYVSNSISSIKNDKIVEVDLAETLANEVRKIH